MLSSASVPQEFAAARRGVPGGYEMVYARLTVAPLQASWLAAGLLLNWIVAPVQAPLFVPEGTSALTVIAALASVKSVASQVPAGAPPALVTELMLAVTVPTRIDPLLGLVKSPESVCGLSPGYIAVSVLVWLTVSDEGDPAAL